MINLIYQGQYALFLLILIAVILSLSIHEFGHAATAKIFGDDTAQRMGRLTLNPLAHIDPVGLLMLVIGGIGWAKPVPTNPNNFTSRWADLLISAAGPGMNLLLAVVAVNALVLVRENFPGGEGAQVFLTRLAFINLALMLFNLIPLGPLDGHYILPYFLTRKWAHYYRIYNAQYGFFVLLGLFLLSAVAKVPVFGFLFSTAIFILPRLVFV